MSEQVHIKVLVIRFSSIGDIVLTTPIVRCIKSQLDGEVEVHYVTKRQYASILEVNPNVDKVYSIEKSTAEVIDQLKAEQYDYIIDLHKNLRSSQIKRKLKIIDFTFDKLNIEKWLLVNFKVNKLPDIHIVDRYFEAVKPLGVVNDEKGLDYFIPEDQKMNRKDWPEPFHGKYVVLVIGAKQIGKKPTVDQWVSIIQRIEQPVVLIGGPEDTKEAQQIIALTNGANVLNLVGTLNLHQSASVVQQADIIVTPDTGMMHIASAFKKKIISIWGCTIPQFGMYPYLANESSVMIEPHNAPKRPCSKLGDKCKCDPPCIERVSVDEIVEAVKRLSVL